MFWRATGSGCVAWLLLTSLSFAQPQAADNEPEAESTEVQSSLDPADPADPADPVDSVDSADPADSADELSTPIGPEDIPAITTDVTSGHSSAAEDPIWNLYHRAALALADDDDELAVELLREAVRQGATLPDGSTHEACIEARRLLRRVGEREDSPTRSGERRSELARAELSAHQAVLGASAALVTCAAADCDGVRTWALSSLVGASSGLVLSLVPTRGGVTPGQTQLYSTLPRWGYYNGWLLFTTLGVNFDDNVNARNGATMASFLVGHGLSIGAAIALDFTLSPTAGDVAIMDSFMILASSVLAQIYAAADAFDIDGDEARLQGLMGGILVANVAAMSVAAILTKHITFTRGRALLLDAGMAVGVGVGIGLVALIQGEDIDQAPVFTAGAIGAAAGFGLTYYLTRNIGQRRELPVELSMAPARGGAVASLRATF